MQASNHFLSGQRVAHCWEKAFSFSTTNCSSFLQNNVESVTGSRPGTLGFCFGCEFFHKVLSSEHNVMFWKCYDILLRDAMCH